MGWAFLAKTAKAKSAPWIMVPITEGGRYQIRPRSTVITDHEYGAPAGGASYQRAASYNKNFPSHQGVDDMFHWPALAMAQTPTLTKWHAYLQQRSVLSQSPLSLQMQQLLGSVKHIDPPNFFAPIRMSVPATCKGIVEIPGGAWYTDSSSQDNPLTWHYLDGNGKKLQ